MRGEAIGFENISVDSGVVSLNAAIYNPPSGQAAARAFITAEAGAMRYRVDGQNPTASVGHPLLDSDFLELESIYLIKNFRAIKHTAAAGKISVTYEA
jgi:hypothetical protein